MDVGVHDLAGFAAAAKVDDFDSTLVLLFKQDVLRLEVAMYDLEFVEKEKSFEDLYANAPDQVHGESVELVLLDELV